ncbi:hypothetical protein ACSSS7_004357 [Eimeria intestinalis]
MLNLIARQAAALQQQRQQQKQQQQQRQQQQQQHQQGISSITGIYGAPSPANPPMAGPPPPPFQGMQKGALHFHPLRWRSSPPSFVWDIKEEAMESRKRAAAAATAAESAAAAAAAATSAAGSAASGDRLSFAASKAPSSLGLLSDESHSRMHASASFTFGQDSCMHPPLAKGLPHPKESERGGTTPREGGPDGSPEERRMHAIDGGLHSYKRLLSRAGQNAVVSLMKRLELSREEKQRRSDELIKRLVVGLGFRRKKQKQQNDFSVTAKETLS